MRKLTRSGVLVVVVVAAMLGCRAARDRYERPGPSKAYLEAAPITLSATCVGMFAGAKSWDVSINAARQASLNVGTTHREFQVSQERWDALRAGLIEERFFDLRADYGDRVVCGETRSIVITTGNFTRAVRIHSFVNRMIQTGLTDEDRRALRIAMLVRALIPDHEAADLTENDRRMIGSNRE